MNFSLKISLSWILQLPRIGRYGLCKNLRRISHKPFVQTRLFATSQEPVKGYRKGRKFNEFPFKYHQEIELKIDDVTNTGLGLGKYSRDDPESPLKDWVVMVPHVISGELVRVRIHTNFNRYSEADLIEVIEPSSSRITPSCKYFGVCGGCQYQHMTIEFQRELKRKHVVHVLKTIGKIGNAEDIVNPVVGTEHTYQYRSKITPHYNAPRNPDEDVVIGFQRLKSKSILDIDECLIATPNVGRVYSEKRDEIKESVLQKIREAAANPDPKKKKIVGATLLFREDSSGNVITNQVQEMKQTVENLTFSYKANDFFQNNPHVLPFMVNHVMSHARKDFTNKSSTSLASQPIPSCKYLVDAYCGSGLFAVFAGQYFEKVIGIEISSQAVQNARKNALQNNMNNVLFKEGSSDNIFKEIGHLPSKHTVIVIDPPRAGCTESFLSQLCSFRPKRIIYVSCDPATQARDALYLWNHAYVITDITPFDLFPQTRHIENVMVFEDYSNKNI